MRAKKLLTSRQIFRYAVPARTVTKNTLDVSHKLGGRLPCLQLPPQPLRGLLPILPLGEQMHDECEQFA